MTNENGKPRILTYKEYQELTEKLAEAKERIKRSPTPMYTTTPEGRFVFIDDYIPNPAFKNFFNLTDEILKVILSSILYVDENRRKEFQDIMKTKGVVKSFEAELYKNPTSPTDKTIVNVSLDVSLIKKIDPNTNQEIIFYEGSMQDITEKKKEERFDKLTRIYTWSGLEGIFKTLKEQAKIHQRPLSLCYFDLDDFKKYNDSFGHAQGNQALITLAQTLRDVAREEDNYCREHGEEFILILPETNKEKAIEVAEKLRSDVEKAKVPLIEDFKPNDVISYPHDPTKITVSIGLSSFPEISSLESLLKDADRAMYKAKGAGRNCVRVYQQ